MTQPQEHFEQATQGILKACEDASCMARDHVDAAVKSASVVSKGLEEIARNTQGMIQESVASGVNASKTLLAVRNLTDAAHCHNEFMKECFDRWVASTGKISEISARMMQDAMAPITAQTTNIFNKISQNKTAA